jgi:hypothetical protein
MNTSSSNLTILYNSGGTIYRIFRFVCFNFTQRGNEFSTMLNFVTLQQTYGKKIIFEADSRSSGQTFSFVMGFKTLLPYSLKAKPGPILSQYVNMQSCTFLQRSVLIFSHSVKLKRQFWTKNGFICRAHVRTCLTQFFSSAWGPFLSLRSTVLNVLLEKDGENQLDRSFEKWKSIT